MRKAVFSLIGLLVLGFVFSGCDNGNNPPGTTGVYSGYGVWLISETDFDAWNENQPTPTAMGIIDTLPASFSVNFYNPQNYNTTENPGWNIDSSQTSWTAVSGDYYVLIVPMYYPGGVAGQGEFWWMFDEGKISASGSTSTKTSITANPFTFSLTDFANMSDLQ